MCVCGGGGSSGDEGVLGCGAGSWWVPALWWVSLGEHWQQVSGSGLGWVWGAHGTVGNGPFIFGDFIKLCDHFHINM